MSLSPVVVVTGASRGIGAGLAKIFDHAELRLGLCSRRPPALAPSPTVLAEQVDVTDGPAVEDFALQVFEKFGAIDVWINNAGILDPVGPLREIPAAEFKRNLDVNVMGVFHGSRTYASLVRKHQKSGVLINISSGAGRNGYAGWSAYCASKAAVDLLTECIQLEEQEAGLRAYALAPGVIDTDMQTRIRECTPEQFPTVEKFRQMKSENTFNSIEAVAERIQAIAFGAERPGSVRMDLRD